MSSSDAAFAAYGKTRAILDKAKRMGRSLTEGEKFAFDEAYGEGRDRARQGPGRRLRQGHRRTHFAVRQRRRYRWRFRQLAGVQAYPGFAGPELEHRPRRGRQPHAVQGHPS
jgi:hypothetical protein